MIFTKLFIPPIPENFVLRQGLIDKLNEGLNRKLVLISAPAGYGKTSLLSHWTSKNNNQTAWCSLDARDNDPIEFLELLLKAVQKAQPEIGKSSLELLKAPGTPNIEYIIELLLNDFLSLKNNLVLILDDFHLIQDKNIIDILSAIIEYKPDKFLVIISTRSDPPIHFSRFRSQNEIIEIRSSELSFSRREIGLLLNKNLNLELSEHDLGNLEQKTEGWIAGLQLTALTIQGQKDKSAYIERIAGNNRYIMDYLLEEVLNNHDKDIENFLLLTSILENLSAPLCDTILGSNNSQKLLESLEKSNAFLIPLDNERKWYRYHHLFADLLKHKLEIRYLEKIPALHLNASEWFEKNKIPQFAIEHALYGGDINRAIKLLNHIIEDLCEKHEYYRVYKLCSLFNENDLLSNKSKKVAAIYVWILATAGMVNKARIFLSKLQKVLSENTEGNDEILSIVHLTYAYIYISEGKVKDAFENSELAVKYLPEKDNIWKIGANITAGQVLFLRFEFDKSLKFFEFALNLSSKINKLYILYAVSEIAFVLLYQGQYRKSYALCSQLLTKLKADPTLDKYKFEIASSALNSIIGFIQIEWNLIDEGLKKIKQANESAQKVMDILFKAFCEYNYAEACYRLNKKDKALSVLNDLELKLKNNNSGGFYFKISALKNKVLIDNEDYKTLDYKDSNLGYADRNQIFESYYHNIPKARYLISNNEFSEALVLLDEIEEALEKDRAIMLLIEVELLKVKLHFKLKENDKAIQSIIKAINCAQADELLRIFISEGEEIYTMLKELKQVKSLKSTELLNTVSTEFLEKLIKAFEHEQILNKKVVNDVLSTREIDTLKLIAENLSNQEIADKLFISITTVKTHVRNILSKFEVKNRNEAVIKAKEQGVL